MLRRDEAVIRFIKKKQSGFLPTYMNMPVVWITEEHSEKASDFMTEMYGQPSSVDYHVFMNPKMFDFHQWLPLKTFAIHLDKFNLVVCIDCITEETASQNKAGELFMTDKDHPQYALNLFRLKNKQVVLDRQWMALWDEEKESYTYYNIKSVEGNLDDRVPVNLGSLDRKELEDMITILRYLAEYLEWVDKRGLYLVEAKTPRRHASQKQHSKTPWRLPTTYILPMQRLPGTPEHHGTGTGTSKRSHQRRGHYRTLRNERYRNHPKYLQKIWVKPMWVGPTKTDYHGKTYRVIDPVIAELGL